VSRAFVLAVTLALGACRVEPHRVLPPSVDAGPDLRTRPRTSAALTFRVTGRPDTAAAWPYTISWGDGTTDQGTLTDPAPARATHAYAAAGRYTVRVTVTPRAGATLVDTLTAVVEAPATPQTFVGAGDIASCATSHAGATAQLLDGIPGTVFALGDNAYPNGSGDDYAACYLPTWGRHRKRTHPVPGNHDYDVRGASGYFDYFGVAAGGRGAGYYSYDLGDWHVIALNSNLEMSVGSLQERWLRADLAAHPTRCTLAYWHHARFSSGTTHGSDAETQPLWQALYDAGADVVLSGHEHNYERFAPQTPDGTADPARGIREFVVGTGGGGAYRLGPPIANSEAGRAVYGVLKLTLTSQAYRWQFIPVPPVSFSDSGSAACH
jgi:hypothetical protein